MQKTSMLCTQSVAHLEQIVAFDERSQSSRTFVQRYLSLVTDTSRLSHHRAFFEQMLDLLEEQMLMHINYRYWVLQAISEDNRGLMLKSDTATSRTTILRDVLTLLSDLSEQGCTPDGALCFLLLQMEILLGEEMGISASIWRQRPVPLVEARISGQCFIREEPLLELSRISEESLYTCLFGAASEGSVKYPTSSWPRCLLAMLSLSDVLARVEASLGFLDAFLLLRELESRDQRVCLLTTIMRYCEL